jgi:isopenicillin-N epimerase
MLDPDGIYLNTGSFGSQPRQVFDCLLDGLRTIEADPTVNHGLLTKRANDARDRFATFLNAPAQDLAFTTNVTVSINLVVLGLDWKPGDEILASDQEYGAINHCLHHAEQRMGVVVRRAHIPVPPDGPEDFLQAFESGFTDRTRLVLCSHISSRTGFIAPLKALAEMAHAHGALIAVDGAHAPGMIPLDLMACGCDFYGGNCHKWLCAPKGTGFLHAVPQVQERLHHVMVGWGYNPEGPTRGDDGGLRLRDQPYMWGVSLCGTRDMASLAAVGTAVDVQEEIGRQRILERDLLLAGYVRQRMGEVGWAQCLTPSAPEMSGAITAYHLSGFADPKLGRSLHDRYKITIPAGKDGDKQWLRVSTHFYNEHQEIDRLLEALTELRG